jgi:molybdopterin synthase sulfur carrier subunit
MFITIKYFGQIAEVTAKEEEQIEIEATSISKLLELLYSKYDELRQKDFQVAQNQELVSLEKELTGLEIALLPPFAGG